MSLQTSSLLNAQVESEVGSGTIVAAWLPNQLGISGLHLLIATNEGRLVDAHSSQVTVIQVKPVSAPAPKESPKEQQKNPPVTPLAK